MLLLCFLSLARSYAQMVSGAVKDSTGKAVPDATVSLKTGTGNTIVAYTLTDSKGNFVLRLPAGIATNNLKVEVHSLGYQTAVKNIVGLEVRANITLMAALNELKEVVIKDSRPVLRIHGDTLGYKVSDFASPQDRTIGEVLRKLPGISVAEDGTVSYNNKPISALYIGGDNLLDNKYNIATNTIPQMAVSQVQVIQNDQHIKVLQNKVMSENVALNLTFKKDARLHPVGLESIGAGLPGNYAIDLNAMMFKDSYKAINYLSGNNVGYNVQRTLISHTLADYLQQSDNPLPLAVLSLGAISTPALEENRYLFDHAGVVSTNNLINLKKNVQLRVNAYYVHDSQQQDYQQQTTIFLPGDTVRYNEIQHNRSVPNILHTQFTLNINQAKYYLNDALLIDNKNMSSYSELKTDSSAVNQVLRNRALDFSNEFNIIRSLKSNNIIQAFSYISHSAEPENLAISPGLNAAIFNNNVPYAQLVQTVNTPGWYTNNYFSFKIPSAKMTQSYRTGFSVQSQTLTSGLNIVQNNNNSSALKPDSAVNHVDWTKKKLYAEASYDLPGTILQANLTLPVILQQINYADSSYALDKRIARLYFNPHLSIKYQVGPEKFVNLFYSYRNQIGTIENIYPGYILTDYRTLYANNARLNEEKIQQAGGVFSYRKALTLFFWSINALYIHTAANSVVSSVITNNLQKSIELPYPNSTDSWTISGSISKYSFALHTTFSGLLQWQSNRSLQIQNNTLLPFNTTSKTVNINADTKISGQVNFSYKATLRQTGSHSPVEAQAYQINQLLQQASVNYNPGNNVQFKLSGEHYFTRQQGNPNLKYLFADASLRFRITQLKSDLELNAVNFLNVKIYNAPYLSANRSTLTSYTLPGKIILFKVLFNL